MIHKKIIIFLLIVSIIPMGCVYGTDPIDDLSHDISESWREAKTIWQQMYLFAKIEIWNKYIVWRIAPIWNSMKGWAEIQVKKLKDAFKSDVEKAKEEVKEEIKGSSKTTTRKIWEIIVDGVKKK